MSDETTPRPPSTEPNIPAREPTPPKEPTLAPEAPPAAGIVVGSDPILRDEPYRHTFADGRVDEVRAAHDSTGAPRSAEIVPTTVPLDALGRPILRSPSVAAPLGVEVPGRAQTRVLASGLVIPAHLRTDRSDEVRLFTAATRTMRNRVLYEVDAPIPLTRGEFLLKRRSKAVREDEFDDGHEDRSTV